MVYRKCSNFSVRLPQSHVYHSSHSTCHYICLHCGRASFCRFVFYFKSSPLIIIILLLASFVVHLLASIFLSSVALRLWFCSLIFLHSLHLSFCVFCLPLFVFHLSSLASVGVHLSPFPCHQLPFFSVHYLFPLTPSFVFCLFCLTLRFPSLCLLPVTFRTAFTGGMKCNPKWVGGEPNNTEPCIPK